jgi:hypothetical protein
MGQTDALYQICSVGDGTSGGRQDVPSSRVLAPTARHLAVVLIKSTEHCYRAFCEVFQYN